MERRGAELFLEWAPRAANKEADALADGSFGDFDPALRVLVDFARMNWLVMDRLLVAGAQLHKEMEGSNAERPVVKGRRQGPRRKDEKLRVKDPW